MSASAAGLAILSHSGWVPLLRLAGSLSDTQASLLSFCSSVPFSSGVPLHLAADSSLLLLSASLAAAVAFAAAAAAAAAPPLGTALTAAYLLVAVGFVAAVLDAVAVLPAALL